MSNTSEDMARTKLFADAARIRFPDGAFAEIDKVLRTGEDRSDFIREAVDTLVKLRELNPQLKADDPLEMVDERIAQARSMINKMFTLYAINLKKRASKHPK